MPVFEYRCQSCDRRFSWLQGVVGDQAEPTCPHCGGRDIRRLISRFAVNRSEDDDLGDDDLGEDMEPEAEFGDESGDEFADDEDEE